jgi:zinc transporter 7
MGTSYSTFLGIAIHNVSASSGTGETVDLAAGIRRDAPGLLGTTVQLADLVLPSLSFTLTPHHLLEVRV